MSRQELASNPPSPSKLKGIVADVTVVGSGYAALILVAKYLNAGIRVHHITRDKKFFPDLEHRDELAKDCTSAIAPMRGSDGYHYLSSPATVESVLHQSFALLRAFPILAEKMKRRRTLYHFLKSSTFDWATALKGLATLKETYTSLYNAKESDHIRKFMPSPEQLYRIVDDPAQWEYLDESERVKILHTIITTEGIVPIKLIRPELEEVFLKAAEKGLYTVSRGKHVEAIISRGAKHYVMSHDVDNKRAGQEVCETSVVSLHTWDRTNQLLKNIFVYRDDEYKGVKPIPLGIRVKQVVRFWVPQSLVGELPDTIDESGKRQFNLDAPLNKLQSTFIGYTMEHGCMIAIDDEALVKNPDGGEEEGYWCRATVSRLTNREAVDDLDGDDAIRAKIDACYVNKARTDEIQQEIIAEVARRFKLKGRIYGVISHLGTVLTGTMGLSPTPPPRPPSNPPRRRRALSRLGSAVETVGCDELPEASREKRHVTTSSKRRSADRIATMVRSCSWQERGVLADKRAKFMSGSQPEIASEEGEDEQIDKRAKFMSDDATARLERRRARSALKREKLVATSPEDDSVFDTKPKRRSASISYRLFASSDEGEAVRSGAHQPSAVSSAVQRCFDVEKMEKNPLRARRALHVEHVLEAFEEVGPILLALSMKAINAESVAMRVYMLSEPFLRTMRVRSESTPSAAEGAFDREAVADQDLGKMARIAHHMLGAARRQSARSGSYWLRSSEYTDSERRKLDGIESCHVESHPLYPLSDSARGRFLDLRGQFGVTTPAGDNMRGMFSFANFSSRPNSATGVEPSSPHFYKLSDSSAPTSPAPNASLGWS